MVRELSHCVGGHHKTGSSGRFGDACSRFGAGMVGVDVPTPAPFAYYTFAGWKVSGFGDLIQHGADAFRFCTKTKTVTTRCPSRIRYGTGYEVPEGC